MDQLNGCYALYVTAYLRETSGLNVCSGKHVGDGNKKYVMHQRAFSRTADAGHCSDGVKRELHVYVFQVIFPCSRYTYITVPFTSLLRLLNAQNPCHICCR